MIKDTITNTDNLRNIEFSKNVLLVLTVPAEYTDGAKAIMRECAYDAGLFGNSNSENDDLNSENDDPNSENDDSNSENGDLNSDLNSRKLQFTTERKLQKIFSNHVKQTKQTCNFF